MDELKPLVPEEHFLEMVNKKRRELGVSEEELGRAADLNQSQVSRTINNKRNLRYKEAEKFVEILIGRMSKIPKEATAGDIGVSEEKLVWAFTDEKTSDIAARMMDNGFSQLPVKERESEHCKGVVTELSILRRILFPQPPESKIELSDLSEMKLIDANVIEPIPEYPVETPLTEIAQILTHYYTILLTEHGITSGIITRADILKLIIPDNLIMPARKILRIIQ